MPLALCRFPIKPRLSMAGVHPEEKEPSLQGKLAVQLRIANMVVLFSRKAGLHIRETLLGRNKIHLDAIPVPDVLLYGKWTVRTAAYDAPMSLSFPHHVHSDGSRRVSCFQGSIYVKANKYCQGRPFFSPLIRRR